MDELEIAFGEINSYGWDFELFDYNLSNQNDEKAAFSLDYSRKILNNMQVPYWSIDLVSNELYISKKLESIIGYSLQEIVNDQNLWKKIVHEDDQVAFIDNFKKVKAEQQVKMEFRVINANSQVHWLKTEVVLVSDSAQLFNKMIGIIFDISELKKSQYFLEESQESLNSIIEAADVIVWSINLLTNESTYSSSSEKIYGIPSEAFNYNSKLWLKVIHPDDHQIVLKNREKLLLGNPVSTEYRIIRPSDQTIRWIEDRAKPVMDKEGKVIRLNGVKVDITKRKLAEEKLVQLQNHDPFTGLPNRLKLENDLKELAKQSQSHESKIGLMVISTDRIKLIMDTFGQKDADQFQFLFLKRLKECLAIDEINLYHYRREEFVFVLNDTDQFKLERVAECILNSFHSPIEIRNIDVFVLPSIGISMGDIHNLDKDILLKQADTAMREAKESGRNQWKFYNRKKKLILNQLLVESELRKAITENQLELHYQPFFDMKGSKIVGMEALVRWIHPQKGLIPPMEFIPIAEETGFIIEIGEWVLREACRQNKEWQEMGLPPQTVSVNVSISQFKDDNFIEKVKNVLLDTGLHPHYLELEITESVMQNTNESIQIIHNLKQLGVKISIDDFGTGYSSLGTLMNLPMDKLKIDKSFIEIVGSSNEEIVKTIIELGKSLKMSVLAEGIETEKQKKFLLEKGCHLGQGFLFYKPQSAEQFRQLLENEH